MSIRTAATLAIVGLLVRFVLRTGNTIWPTWFDSAREASSVALTFTVANVLVLAFFLVVRTAAGRMGAGWLARVAGIAAAGTILALLLDLRFLLATLGARGAWLGRSGDNVAVAFMVVSTVTGLWFLAAVHTRRRDRLPSAAALAGGAFFTGLALVTFGFQIAGEAPTWFLDAAGAVVRLLVVLAVIAFAAILRFLVAVRRNPTALVGD